MVPLADEGGFFKEIYRSPVVIDNQHLDPGRYGEGKRNAGTIIYFLMSYPDGFSAMHLVKTDETFMWLAGDPFETLLLNPDGSVETFIMGPDVEAGHRPFVTIKKDVWQGSRVLPKEDGKGWALITATLSPGFDWADFELGEAAALIEKWPLAEPAILALVREEAPDGKR